jgi:hypothetical protein
MAMTQQATYLLRQGAHLYNLLDALERAQRNAMLRSARVLAGRFHSLRACKLPHHLRL